MLKPLPRGSWSPAMAARLLSRAAFGCSLEERNAAAEAGLSAAVDALVDAPPDDDLFPPPERILDQENFVVLRRAVAESRGDPSAHDQARRALRQAEARAVADLRGWWIRRMRYSLCPLRECMTLFWHGHFATSVEKARSARMMWIQNETFRACALGSFRDLAVAVSRDPAMMRYLDVAGSSRERPNENFARELMELFLLGEGHYGEDDIREAARAFTGYRLRPANDEPQFLPARHDSGEKALFGRRGNFSGEEAVGIILDQPRCAEFVSAKLWEWFAGEKLEPKLGEALAAELRASDYRIGEFLRVALSSEEFYRAASAGAQVKSPVQWLTGSSKALQTRLSGDLREQAALKELGQTLFAPPNVKGWEGGRAWISATTLLARCNLASSLFLPGKGNARGAVDVDAVFPADARRSPEILRLAVSERLFPAGAPERERARFADFLGEQKFPAQDNTVCDLLRLMMSSPEYQLA